MKSRVVAALLSSCCVADGGFLDKLSQVQQGDLQPPNFGGKSPVEIADTLSKAAAEAAQAAKKVVETGASNPDEAVDKLREHQADVDAIKQLHVDKSVHQVVGALTDAGKAIRQASHEVQAANVSSVKDLDNTIQSASSKFDHTLPSNIRPSNVLPDGVNLHDLTKLPKDKIADEVRKATPQVSGYAESFGRVIAEQVSKAGDLVNRTGLVFADLVHGRVTPGSTGLPPQVEEGIRTYGALPILAGLSLVLLFASGFFVIVHRKVRRHMARSPSLLGGDEFARGEDLSPSGVSLPTISSQVRFQQF